MGNHLRLGLIGLSPGNGHPYSWAAIFNGYQPEVMESCGYPAIPRYLENQSFPADAISDASVTHLWTQDASLSRHIAKASRIHSIVDSFTDLIGKVDAVLLARDDAEMHILYAQPFLEAGIPLYVDKPLALSRNDAEYLISLQRYPGQLFSCSALRYAPELILDKARQTSIGPIKCIICSTPKDWDKYAVHTIEPLLRFVAVDDKVVRTTRWASDDRVVLHVEFSSGLEAQISTFGACNAPLEIRILGLNGWCDLVFADTFYAFRAALQDFIDGVRAKDVRISTDEMLAVVDLVAAGRKE